MASTFSHFQIGDLRVARVEESCQPAFPPAMMFPDLPSEALQRQLQWMAPNYYDPQAGLLVASIHSWVVRTRHHTILIDTCGGNHKERPEFPPLHQLDLPWLERLAAVDVAPEQVDFVMCTHLHLDHVGWNTRLKDGRWVPTFPNAKYLFDHREYEYWNDMPIGSRSVNEGVIEDSVLPVVEAGLSQFVDDGYTVDNMLTVEATPGHTPGHVMIRAKAAPPPACSPATSCTARSRCLIPTLTVASARIPLRPAPSDAPCWPRRQSITTCCSLPILDHRTWAEYAVTAKPSRSFRDKSVLGPSAPPHFRPAGLGGPAHYRLQTDEAEAQRNSPMLNFPSMAGPLIVAYGTAELPELCRQSVDYTQAWGERGLPGHLLPIDGADHFSILETLAQPSGELLQALLTLVRG